LEGFSRQVVIDLSEEGLEMGFAAPEGIEADLVGVEVDFAADEAVRPEGINGEGVSEQVDVAMVVGTSEEDDFPGMKLKGWLPGMGEGLSERGVQKPFGGAGTGSSDELVGLTLKRLQGLMVEATPDLGLPAAVVAFDGGLEARLAGWREDRGHLEGQAQPGDSADVIGVLVSALEPGVVVELGVAGQTDLTPVFHQGDVRRFCRDDGSWPGGGQAAVKGDGVKDLDIDSAFNDKAGDDIEAIGFELAGGDIGQIPAAWRRWTPHSSFAVQSSPPLQNATDRPNRRDLAVASLNQLSPNGDITKLSKITTFFEFVAKPEDLFFHVVADPIGGTAGSRRLVRPVHSSQAFFPGSADPSSHGGITHPKTTRDRSDRSAPTDGSDDVMAKLSARVFLNPCFCFLLSAEQITSAEKTNSSPEAGCDLWKLTGRGKPSSTPPSHTPWKTLRVSHISHRPNCYYSMDLKGPEKPEALSRSC
jgi:hypothetical protein